MYYKSILLTIKEENHNRLTITNETIKDNGFFIEAYLNQKKSIFVLIVVLQMLFLMVKNNVVFKMNIMLMSQHLYP